MSEKNLLDLKLHQQKINKIKQEKNKIKQEKKEDSEIEEAAAEFRKIMTEQKIKESFKEMAEWYNSKTEPPLIAKVWADYSKDNWFHSKTIELFVLVRSDDDNSVYPYYEDTKFILKGIYSYEKKEFKCAFWDKNSEGKLSEQPLIYSLNEIQDKARDWFVTGVQQPHVR